MAKVKANTEIFTKLGSESVPLIVFRNARTGEYGSETGAASTEQLAQTGTGYLLGQAQAQAFRNGFFDQSSQLWNEAGVLLVTTHQIVYYKQ